MVRATALIALFSLASCNSSAPSAQPGQSPLFKQVPQRRYAVLIAGDPLKFDVETSGTSAVPVVRVFTNLPDGVSVSYMISRGERSFADGLAKISNGGAKLAVSALDPLLPGQYTLTVVGPSYDGLPDDMKALVGRDYENFRDEILKEGDYGRLPRVERGYNVAGVATASDIAARDGKRDARVRGFAERSCAEKKERKFQATKTPKALAEIDKCADALVREIRSGQ